MTPSPVPRKAIREKVLTSSARRRERPASAAAPARYPVHATRPKTHVASAAASAARASWALRAAAEAPCCRRRLAPRPARALRRAGERQKGRRTFTHAIVNSRERYKSVQGGWDGPRTSPARRGQHAAAADKPASGAVRVAARHRTGRGAGGREAPCCESLRDVCAHLMSSGLV